MLFINSWMFQLTLAIDIDRFENHWPKLNRNQWWDVTQNSSAAFDQITFIDLQNSSSCQFCAKVRSVEVIFRYIQLNRTCLQKTTFQTKIINRVVLILSTNLGKFFHRIISALFISN